MLILNLIYVYVFYNMYILFVTTGEYNNFHQLSAIDFEYSAIDSLFVFCTRLKTYLFKRCFP